MRVLSRVTSPSVALETTLILHGVPKPAGGPLARELSDIVRARHASPALVGILQGQPIVGLSDAELDILLNAPSVPKANTSNLGVILHAKQHGATTVSTTMELASAAGVRVFATGGLGGLHKHLAVRPDISADLAAFTRFPLAVVTSGVKSLLDVAGTRELLESLGIPVIGFRTDHFPAFYLRQSDARVDARFDDLPALAHYANAELTRTGRGIVVCNPIPAADELPADQWTTWLDQAERDVASVAHGRDATPRLLARLHEISQGATLRANLALVRSNAALAADLAREMSRI